MAVPEIEDTLFTVFEKHVRHHHDNDPDDLADAKFTMLFNVQPERLGVRLRVHDELLAGSVSVDVAILYYWARPATTEDDIDEFVKSTALPAALMSASALLVDAGATVGSEVPFYGVTAREGVVETFLKGSGLKEVLADNIAKAQAAAEADLDVGADEDVDVEPEGGPELR